MKKYNLIIAVALGLALLAGGALAKEDPAQVVVAVQSNGGQINQPTQDRPLVDQSPYSQVKVDGSSEEYPIIEAVPKYYPVIKIRLYKSIWEFFRLAD